MDNLEGYAHLIAANQRSQIANEISQLRQHAKGVGPCPYCGGGMPMLGVEVCMHCSNRLVWFGTCVGKLGQEAEVLARYEKLARQLKRAQAFRKKTAPLWGVLVVSTPLGLLCFIDGIFFGTPGETSYSIYVGVGLFVVSWIVWAGLERIIKRHCTDVNDQDISGGIEPHAPVVSVREGSPPYEPKPAELRHASGESLPSRAGDEKGRQDREYGVRLDANANALFVRRIDKTFGPFTGRQVAKAIIDEQIRGVDQIAESIGGPFFEIEQTVFRKFLPA